MDIPNSMSLPIVFFLFFETQIQIQSPDANISTTLKTNKKNTQTKMGGHHVLTLQVLANDRNSQNSILYIHNYIS